jgi:hypothetical protein
MRPLAGVPLPVQHRVGSLHRQAGMLHGILCAMLVSCISGFASANEPPAIAAAPEPVARSQAAALSAVEEPEPHALRAALEELTLGGLGLGYYYTWRELNSQDWEFGYEWSALEARIIGKAYAFDNNYFNTNYLSHPGAGTLYYWVARTNGLGVGSSLAYAATTSFLWEFAGEFRERMSVNDLFMTPLGGMALGESTYQLSRYLSQGCGALTQAFSAMFSPLGVVHSWVDGTRRRDQRVCDAYGLSKKGEHRFELVLGGRLSRSTGRGGSETSGQGRFHAKSELMLMTDAGLPGSGWRTFSSGEVSQFDVALNIHPQALMDVTVTSRTIPVGVYYRRLSPAPLGGVVGREFTAGAGVGVDFNLHRYHGPRGAADSLFVLEMPSLFLRWSTKDSAQRLELGFVAAPTLAGAGAFAQDAYLKTGSRDDLTYPARDHAYNHALGVAANPLIRWTTPYSSLALESRLDSLFAIAALDGDRQQPSKIRVTEFRRRVRLSLAVGRAQGFSWFVDLAVYHRRGTVAEAVWNRVEFQGGTGVGFRL